MSAPREAHPNIEKTIQPGLKAEIETGKKIYLSACTTDENDLSDWASRVLACPESHTRFTSGDCLRVPLAYVSGEYQLEAIRTLFSNDSYDENGWIHQVTYLSSGRKGGETLWSISEWFTGSGQNYKKILSHNQMSRRARLYKNTKIKIPLTLLTPAFKEPILFEIAARKAARSASAASVRLNGELTLKMDSKGAYASYRLKRGDTIYSKVVMKFTARVDATDVMEAVDIICKRSNIRDTRRMKAGDEVKIPLELLSPMYLPPDDPRRKEYDRVQQDAARYSNPVETEELRGIIVILDAGHGGADPGAIGPGRIYEDEVSYDIMCRIKALLENNTMAKVITTVEDRSQKYAPRNKSYFTNDSDEYLLTNPVYKNTSPKVSANLRWYLVNSLFRKEIARGANPDKVVFVSLHADALHPNARGSMVYIPGGYYCRGNGGKSGRVYNAYEEVREKQYVTISYKDRVRSEGLSGELAKYLIDSLKRHNIAIHPQKPIRNHVIRYRRAWVPAVIRHNIVPTKILVEVVNLKNTSDRKLVASPEFRERYARAFVDALKKYYGENGS